MNHCDGARTVDRRRRMRLSAMRSRRGFTLIELMVTLVIFALAGTFIYTVFITQHDSYVAQQDVSETQQDVRVSLEMLTRDLRSTGYGVSGGGTGITAATGSSITFQVAQGFHVSSGASPFLSADPAGSDITVNTVSPFAAGDTVRIMNMLNRNEIGPYTITDIDTGASTLTLSGTPTTAHQGDVVVGAVNTITYSLVGGVLQRTSTSYGTENLADHMLDLQFSYTLDDGSVVSTVTGVANLNKIRMIQVTMSSQTVRDVAKAGSHARTRSLSANIRVHNGLT
jgi:prepilin-type N-terminal cleavage/methylation domain-containing protein